jgi:DNA replication protein DnaC
MSTPQLERMREHSHRLRLYQIENELTARLEQAAKKEISYADFLDDLLTLEIGRENPEASSDAHRDGAVPVPKDHREL